MPLVENLLSNAVEEIAEKVMQLDGDGLIFGGVFTQVYGNIAMWIKNSNNHQLTWTVLGSALVAIGDYFEVNGGWGGLEFVVWDGDNEVAAGRIGEIR